MKILCLLISFYVLLLAVKPCCTDSDCGAGKQAEKEFSAKSTEKANDCKGCSPFFTCGTCAGFILAKPFSHNLKPVAEIPAIKYTAYQQPNIQQVSLAIWQPPKLS